MRWPGIELVAKGAIVAVWLVTITWALTAPVPGWYDYTHAFNERWYTQVADGDRVDQVLPPGFIGLAAGYPGPKVVALRVVSLASAACLVAVVNRQFGARRAWLVASLPWVVVWGSRAQTDMAMTAMAWIGLILATKGRSFLGGLLVGFSTIVKPPGILAATRPKISFMAGVALGAVPFAAWLWIHRDTALGFHAGSSVPFLNIWLNIYGLLLGGAGAWLLLRDAHWRSPWLLPTVLFALFAFAKAPIAHEYYLLPALVGLGLMANVATGRYKWALALNALASPAALAVHWLFPAHGA